MGIKRTLKSLITAFLIVAIIILIISNSKYIWKVFGYIFCEDPEIITIHSISNNYTIGCINIKGTIKGTSKFYSGYTTNIQGDKLYIGLKYNSYFGYDKKTADFNIQIPCNLNKIHNIYLVNTINEVKVK